MCRLLFRALKPLKSSLHFFQVAFFRDEVQPESRVRAFRTHPTARATLACYAGGYACLFFYIIQY